MALAIDEAMVSVPKCRSQEGNGVLWRADGTATETQRGWPELKENPQGKALWNNLLSTRGAGLGIN